MFSGDAFHKARCDLKTEVLGAFPRVADTAFDTPMGQGIEFITQSNCDLLEVTYGMDVQHPGSRPSLAVVVDGGHHPFHFVVTGCQPLFGPPLQRFCLIVGRHRFGCSSRAGRLLMQSRDAGEARSEAVSDRRACRRRLVSYSIFPGYSGKVQKKANRNRKWSPVRRVTAYYFPSVPPVDFLLRSGRRDRTVVAYAEAVAVAGPVPAWLLRRI